MPSEWFHALARFAVKYSWIHIGRVAGLEADLGLVGYQCPSSTVYPVWEIRLTNSPYWLAMRRQYRAIYILYRICLY